MKILNLKLKNINSLYGENEIDFTKPVFTNDGLFAITGKTGAGKSSILDAITLALFGRTPRVDISGSENAVMTRGEKDCYAEITFEINGKKWKSSWKQERTRTGTLKPVHRLISDFENKIIADQVRTCDLEIVNILGLSFEQFTKVILLAQGSFAAFLQAEQKEKGKLLEKITGTEIYGKISIKVFERNKLEQEKLKSISLELDAIKILSEEEIEHLTNENEIISKEKEKIVEQLQKIESVKKWLSDVTSLQAQIKNANEQLPKLEEISQSTKITFEKLENDLKIAKEQQKIQEPIFKKVRELDTKISEKEKLLKPILTAISELEKNKNEIYISIQKQNNELQKSQNLYQEKQKWATENNKYEDLVSNYATIEKENQLLLEFSNDIEKLHSENAILKTKAEFNKNEAIKETKIFTIKNKNLITKIEELETIKLSLIELLGGKELAIIQREKENIYNFGIQIKKLIDVENSILKNRNEIENFEKNLKQFEISKFEISKNIETTKNQIENLEIKINLLDENIKLTKTIKSLEEHRQHLIDGEECPLCGALEHPFAQGNMPLLGDKENELIFLKKDLQILSKSNIQNEKTRATLVSENENALKNIEKEKIILSDNLSMQKEILSELKNMNATFSIPQGENKIASLTKTLSQKRTELKEVNELIEKATTIDKQIANLRDVEIPTLQQEKQNAEKNKINAEINEKITIQQFEDKQKSLAILQEKYQRENTVFLNKLKSYAVVNIESLKKCLDSWNDNKKQIDLLNTQITTLKSSIALHTNNFDTQTKQYNTKQNEKLEIESTKQILFDERFGIFSDKAVDKAEIDLKKFVEDAESAKIKAEKEKNDSNIEIEKIKAIVTQKEKDLLNAQRQNLTERTSQELQTEFDEIKNNAEAFSQKIGANNQILKSNETNLNNYKTKLNTKEKHQKICNKWFILNELIGSVDGKKYRNYAQSLTFEHLIALSNKQLQKMSERYILKRISDSNNPFELSVIDQFQNNDERTAQNLSGGEKFIVSLSLALGLANMASNNMRIDTMFIDEGFGTLDTDYLDVALNALSNLQSEGKIIGVISHLTELKERIATHLEVIANSTGHATIKIKS